MIKIYHNIRCGKSRCALQVLEETEQQYEIIEYLKTPLSADQIQDLLQKLGKKPLEIIRRKESVFKENYQDKNLSDAEWIAAMVAHPILIERPIVVIGDKAWVARDESALEQIKSYKTGRA